MTRQDRLEEHLVAAVRTALEKVGLDTIRRNEFFGTGQRQKQYQDAA